MHANAYADAERFVRKHMPDGPCRIADIGSLDINGCLRPLFNRPGWEYTGYDLVPGTNVDVVLCLPYCYDEIQVDSVDVVVSTQVLEHVRKPWRWIKELDRIIAPGGLLYLCAPHTHPFHEHPVDCWRVWPDGTMALVGETSLQVLECYETSYECAMGRLGDTTLIAWKPEKWQ